MKYIGITIGPIYKTLAKAEKTRELWGASYLFSYLSRRLIETLLAKGVHPDQILNPTADGLPLAAKPGVGLYSDRIFLLADDQTFNTVQQAITEVKEHLASKILEGIQQYAGYDLHAALFQDEILNAHKLNAAGQNVKTFLEQYFQVYALEADEPALALSENGTVLGWFSSLNRYLDHLELRSSLTHFDPDPVKVFLRAINHTFLLRDALQRRHFDSLYEIATNELRFIRKEENYSYRTAYDHLISESLNRAIARERIAALVEGELSLEEAYKEEEQTEEDLLDQIYKIDNIKPDLRTYHRYVAIVHADADRMGQFIGNLSAAEMREFTRRLLAFSKEVNNLIAGQKYTHDDPDLWGYGGAPVYIGGDDLVFFAPVASQDSNGTFRTIFHLIRAIDECFDQFFNERDSGADNQYKLFPHLSVRPTISYGISISYLKYPLKEAFVRSRELQQEAKAYATRNRLVFEVQKHSGQTFGGVINKHFPLHFNEFLTLLDHHRYRAPEGDQAARFINSLTYKIDLYRAAFLSAVQDPVALEAFFDYTFNESVHDRYRTYLNAIRDFMYHLFQQSNQPNGQGESEHTKLNTVYGLLRFIHFIRDNEFKN